MAIYWTRETYPHKDKHIACDFQKSDAPEHFTEKRICRCFCYYNKDVHKSKCLECQFVFKKKNVGKIEILDYESPTDGRSAKELARYITATLPNVPSEIKAVIADFTHRDSEFEWAAEYVTDFASCGLGRGNGIELYFSKIVIEL